MGKLFKNVLMVRIWVNTVGFGEFLENMVKLVLPPGIELGSTV